MDLSKNVKIVVFVPESHTDVVRDAIGKAGAGRIGNYTFCSFSSKGTGRFTPGEGAEPTIGAVGKWESVEEERIEVVCDRNLLKDIVAAIKKVHPYEEVAIDVYPLEDFLEGMKKSEKGKLTICSRNHKFYKSTALPVCPKCYPGYYKKRSGKDGKSRS